MHRTPAGLPSGIPGIGEDIDGAIQQAPQCFLHFMMKILCEKSGFFLNTQDVVLLLLMSSIGVVGGYALLSAQLTPKTKSGSKDVHLQLNLNPPGIPQVANHLNVPPAPGIQLGLTF